MVVEKVFAIQAEAPEIWDALWLDLSKGGNGAFSVESSNPPHSLVIKVTLAGIPSLLTYTIKPASEACEVSATIEPLSPRYVLYQIVTFGHLRTNFEIMLVQALSNLKDSVEGFVDTDGEDISNEPE